MRDRLWVMAAPVVALLAFYTLAGLVAWQLFIVTAPEPAETEDVSDISIIVTVFALLVAVVAGVEIARARVVRGLARWSLLIAVVLVAGSVVSYFASVGANWGLLPCAIGILLVGLSWWRAGLPSAARVPVGSKSLAE
jgi:cytochrome c oxidase subunit IV